MDTCHDITLTGLIGSKPIGALAAFGLLRWCEEIEGLRGATLRWALEDDWIAVLGTPQAMSAEELCTALLAALAAEKLGHLNWSEDGKLRVPVSRFRERCAVNAAAASRSTRSLADFDAAYGCAVVADNKDRLTPTRLDMTSGQQCFLELLAKLATTLVSKSGNKKKKPRPLLAVQEALFGPWSYGDDEHALGWDADAERMHALRAVAPTADTKNKSVRFAVWLAHYALPLLPSVPIKTRLETTGFIRQRRERPRFRWPVWEAPLGAQALASLLGCAELVGSGAEIALLQRRGVAAVYESIRHEFGQGYGVFRPARLVEARAAEPARPSAPMIF